jgi:aminobenzoyl-glutamate utilization protein B
MVHAAKVMAAVAAEALGDAALIARAKADHRTRTEAVPYECPLPADVVPPVPARTAAG